MRKVYLLMAAAIVVLAGCKNNGSKKAKSAEETETPVENVVNAMDEAITAIEADAEMDAKTALEKLSSADASGLLETPEEMLKKNPNAAIPFSAVENKPTFNDSDANEFSKWVSEQVKYPQDAIDENIQGKVVLQFTVNKEGQVEDVQVLHGVSESLDAEAVRVVSSSPKWEPGSQNGTPVNVKYTFPVVFRLN
jgi:protein TonB